MSYSIDSSRGGGATQDGTTAEFFKHGSGQRIQTESVITKALKEQYPRLEVIIINAANVDLLGFANSGNAEATLVEEKDSSLPAKLSMRIYFPPPSRVNGGDGILLENLSFGKFLYKFEGAEYVVYLAKSSEGPTPFPAIEYYLLAPTRSQADNLLRAAGKWSLELHHEIWVFDMGYWQKNADLFRSIQKASWDAVILDPEMKQALIDDHLSFFDGRETFRKLQVPWKRGLIYHGPPGNGKTISIKATMKMLLDRKDPIPSLYVRSLVAVVRLLSPNHALLNPPSLACRKARR
jgi:transitional endoplasmic reticulum ATPase